jgi:small subunit ribosomal protein S9
MSDAKKNPEATGKRKNASARVRILRNGTGHIQVNHREVDEYFRRPTLRMIIEQPLRLVNLFGQVDIQAFVKGGGLAGQAGAIKHGLSRALLQVEAGMRAPLKRAGFLTRDSRKTERKKYGQPGARKRFQYSKR